MAEQDGQTLRVVGAAIIDGGRCLVARRAAHKQSPLRWEFPGGQVEAGERPEEALARELEEELSLEVEVGAWLARGEERLRDGRRVVLDVYRARLVAGEPVLRDHDRVRWVEAGGLAALEWCAADVPTLPAVRAQLEAAEGG